VKTFRLHKELIHKVFKAGIHEIGNLRFYVIARELSAQQAGYFTLNEFMDYLQTEGYFKTLHHAPGNDRTRFKRKLEKKFSASMLFEKTIHGFKIRSFRQLSHKDQTHRDIDSVSLRASYAFHDALIGIVSEGIKSTKTISKQTGFTERRIQQAVKRNDERGTWTKTNRLIITESGQESALRKTQYQLLTAHGIATKIIRKGRESLLCLFSANQYNFANVSRQKDSGRSTGLIFTDKVKQAGSDFYFFKNETEGFQKYLEQHGFNLC